MKSISTMTTSELLVLAKSIDAELWEVGGIWISKGNYREYTITKNMRDHVNFSYVDGWGKSHSGVSTKQAFLENYTRYKDIQK